MTKVDVIKLETELVEAIKSSDLKFLNAVLHDDLLFMAPNGEVITKQMDLASHAAGEMIVEQLVPAIGDVKLFNDTAIVVIDYDTQGKMLGMPLAGKFRYIRIWKQFNEGLKVIGGSCFKLS